MSSGDRDDLEAIVKLSGHIIMRPRFHMYSFMGGWRNVKVEVVVFRDRQHQNGVS